MLQQNNVIKLLNLSYSMFKNNLMIKGEKAFFSLFFLHFVVVGHGKSALCLHVFFKADVGIMGSVWVGPVYIQVQYSHTKFWQGKANMFKQNILHLPLSGIPPWVDLGMAFLRSQQAGTKDILELTTCLPLCKDWTSLTKSFQRGQRAVYEHAELFNRLK